MCRARSEIHVPSAAVNHVYAASSVSAAIRPRGWTDPTSTPRSQSAVSTTAVWRISQIAPSNLARIISVPLSGVVIKLIHVSFSRSEVRLAAASLATPSR